MSQNPRPVRPRDAASLIIWREGRGGVEVLMGRRHPRNAFAPSVYVFPGGKVAASDREVRPAAPLDPAVAALTQAGPERARWLALAAVRETWEESGLMLGAPGLPGGSGDASWRAFAEAGLAPALDRLGYVGRAITPTESPIRFHARFFICQAEAFAGTHADSPELADLGFRPLAEARRLPLIDVTEFMLDELMARVAATGTPERPPGEAGAPPLFAYRRGAPAVRRG